MTLHKKYRHLLSKHQVTSNMFESVVDYRGIQTQIGQYKIQIDNFKLDVKLEVQSVKDLYNDCTWYSIYAISDAESDIALLAITQ